MNKQLYIDIHAIQTVPPSCVNRDDTGSPKTARFGGVTRARVSSQSWKHEMRKYFLDKLSEENIGERTKHLLKLLVDSIVEQQPSISRDDAIKIAEDAMKLIKLTVEKPKKGESRTENDKIAALIFVSKAQVKEFARLALQGEGKKDAYQKALKAAPSMDMALFGRMVASDPSLNYDAASQVANAISTHEVHNEFDYFTAVDDCAPEDNAGAGHVGTVEFNSSTLYRYATVNASELDRWLGNQTPATICSFVEAFICSMPTGKQNTFANRTFPDYVYVTLRTNQPVNLSGAFEKPVVSKNGYVEQSVARLEEYAQKVNRKFAGAPTYAFVVSDEESALGENVTLPELLSRLEAVVKEVL